MFVKVTAKKSVAPFFLDTVYIIIIYLFFYHFIIIYLYNSSLIVHCVLYYTVSKNWTPIINMT